jgi:uncharacterized OB-fold protein
MAEPAPAPAKPRPRPTEATTPFWEGLAAGEVRIPRCNACGGWVWYPRLRCNHCLSDRLTWTAVPGTGTVHTFTVTRQPIHPAFADETPQVQAIVTLDGCGVRMTTTLVDVCVDAAGARDVAVGAPVAPVFDAAADGTTLLRFRLAPIAPG